MAFLRRCNRIRGEGYKGTVRENNCIFIKKGLVACKEQKSYVSLRNAFILSLSCLGYARTFTVTSEPRCDTHVSSAGSTQRLSRTDSYSREGRVLMLHYLGANARGTLEETQSTGKAPNWALAQSNVRAM